jgi:hypothetical protein
MNDDDDGTAREKWLLAKIKLHETMLERYQLELNFQHTKRVRGWQVNQILAKKLE